MSVQFLTLLALALVATCSATLFTVPLDYANPSVTLGLPFVGTHDSSLPVAFVIIDDKYSEYPLSGSESSVFHDRYAERYSAQVFTIAPRGWHGSGGFPGSVSQLPHFTVENSLRDIESFLSQIVNPDGSRKVVVAGNGHGGTIAALFRMKYSSKAIAAVADNAFLGTSVSRSEEAEYATKMLEPEVAEAFRNATNELYNIIIAGDAKKITSQFSFCDVPSDSVDRMVATMWYNTMYPVVRALGVQSNRSPMEQATAQNIKKIMLANDEPLNNLARVVRAVRETTTSCIETDYGSFVKNYRNDGDGTMTLVGKCLQLGALPIPSFGQVFFPGYHGVDEEFFGTLCKSLLGPKFDFDTLVEGAELFEATYGGTKAYAGSSTFHIVSASDPLLSQTVSSCKAKSCMIVRNTGLRGTVLRAERSSDALDVKENRLNLELFLDTILG